MHAFVSSHTALLAFGSSDSTKAELNYIEQDMVLNLVDRASSFLCLSKRRAQPEREIKMKMNDTTDNEEDADETTVSSTTVSEIYERPMKEGLWRSERTNGGHSIHLVV